LSDRSFETSGTELSRIVIFCGLITPKIEALKLQELNLAEF
jgi:hypothetical protein